MKKENFNLEEKLGRIQEIVTLLDGELSNFNQLMDNYEEGINLVVECRKFLESAEQKVIEISNSAKDIEMSINSIDEKENDVL